MVYMRKPQKPEVFVYTNDTCKKRSGVYNKKYTKTSGIHIHQKSLKSDPPPKSTEFGWGWEGVVVVVLLVLVLVLLVVVVVVVMLMLMLMVMVMVMVTTSTITGPWRDNYKN